jgi:hypothetical protein
MLTDPRLVIIQTVQQLKQLQITLKRQGGVLALPVEGSQEYTKLHSLRKGHL